MGIKVKVIGNMIKSDKLKKWSGKQVQIQVESLEKPEKKKKNWSLLGSVALPKDTDDLNLRDLAYE